MSKPGGKPIVRPKPFHIDDFIILYTLHDDLDRVKGFRVIAQGSTTDFIVRSTILHAWQEMEAFLTLIPGAEDLGSKLIKVRTLKKAFVRKASRRGSQKTFRKKRN